MSIVEDLISYVPESGARTPNESQIAANIRQFWAEVWQNGDLERISSMIYGNTVVDANVGMFVGQEGYREYVEKMRGGLTDVRVSIDHLIIEGQLISMNWHLMGVDSGGIMGHAATNEPVSIACSSLIKYFDNQILNENDQWDIFGLSTQLKAVPADLQAVIDGEEVVNKRVPGSTEPDASNEVLTAAGEDNTMSPEATAPED